MREIGLIVFIVFIASFIGTIASCSYYKNSFEEIERKIESNKKDHEIDKQTYMAEAAAKERGYIETQLKAAETYAIEINALHAHYGDNVRYIDRMHHTASETVKYLPSATRAEVENIAATRTNEVVECSATLKEIDRIAREYSAEIDLFEKRQPNYKDPSDQVEDKKPEPHKLE